MFRLLVLSTVASWLALSTSLFAETRVYTRPLVPAPKDLERLNLQMAWQTSLPVDGVGDGVVSVQLVDDQVFVQLPQRPPRRAECGDRRNDLEVAPAEKVRTGVADRGQSHPSVRCQWAIPLHH